MLSLLRLDSVFLSLVVEEIQAGHWLFEVSMKSRRYPVVVSYFNLQTISPAPKKIFLCMVRAKIPFQSLSFIAIHNLLIISKPLFAQLHSIQTIIVWLQVRRTASWSDLMYEASLGPNLVLESDVWLDSTFLGVIIQQRLNLVQQGQPKTVLIFVSVLSWVNALHFLLFNWIMITNK